MKLYREIATREQADEPTIAILDLWHSLVKQKIGILIEVMVGDRKENPQLSSVSGELYTAFPNIINNKLVLGVWLDSLDNVDSIYITHEVGHWILKLQGFRSMIYMPERYCDIEILLNSMIHHPALYALQRSVGHNPQVEIDSRADQNIEIYAKEKETNEKQLLIKKAFILADDIMNCSVEKREQLEEVLSSKHPNTMKFIEKILDIASHYNLLEPKKNIKCSRRIIRSLELGSEWEEIDGVGGLIKMAESVSKE